MPIVNDKYRGAPMYFHVHAELVRAAQYRGLTTYQDIAVIMGLPTTGAHMGNETGHILGEISEDEASADRPMLSAVAVGVSGKPGPGFVSLAKRLGRLAEGQDEMAFWVAECRRVHDTWRRPLPRSDK
jgi:hypothetical protein